jgi:putative ABC transport system permease protein
MNQLIFGNLIHRPLRSIISAFAVGIEVVMILSIAAIMLGMLNGSKTRTSGIGMDIFVRPSSTTAFAALSSAGTSVKVADVLDKLPHIEVASPVNIQMSMGASLENIYGIDYVSYNALKPFVFITGGPFTGPDDVIVDDYFASSDKGHKVGDTIQILKHNFRICGIVEHGKGGRKFIPIVTMGDITNNPGKASAFYVKSDDVKNQALIRDEIKNTEGMQNYDVQTLDEWLAQMTPDKLPGFNIALRIVIGIAVIIGFLVIFQSMYTAVMERTREIGVLKSMGASQLNIVSVVLRETGLLAVCGIALGVGATYLMRTILHITNPKQDFQLTPQWVLYTVAIALAGALVGALYPALKAARKDPIDALSYE